MGIASEGDIAHAPPEQGPITGHRPRLYRARLDRRLGTINNSFIVNGKLRFNFLMSSMRLVLKTE
jgi:hypothetical protein